MHKNNTASPVLWAVLALPVLYLAALLASGYEEGMTVFDLMGRFSELLGRPFAIHWTEYTLKFMLAALLVYGFTVVLYLSTRENRRPGEEHGSAKWGNPKQLNAKYRDKDPFQNTILTQNVRMGLNGKIHRRNLLQIVIGGSGAGKTRFFVKPNLMQANCSFLVTDPKGETMRAVAPLLLERGYVIKVFDLIDTGRSDAFNPFPYLKDDKDAMKLVNNLIKNTTPKNASNSDPFWEKSEIALDTALILYLLHEAPPEEQNFEMVMYMIENGGAREDDDDFQSPLDMLFEALEEEEPDHVAVREYKIFKQAAGKTAKSILISAAVRLSAFILPQITRITSQDDMELGLMGERKQAVFAIIPDNDGTFNYLVGMLYTCAFQALYGGRAYLEKQDYILMKQKEQLAAQEQKLEELTLKIEDVETLVEEVSDIAYDKAVEVVTDTVRQETHKEDIRLVEEAKKWVLSPERKAPQKEREYAAVRLDGVISKIKNAMQSALTKIQKKLMQPEVKQAGKQQIQEKAKESILAFLKKAKQDSAQRESNRKKQQEKQDIEL